MNSRTLEWVTEVLGVKFKTLVGSAGFPWPNQAQPMYGECGETYFENFDNYVAKNNLDIRLLLSTPAEELIVDEAGVVTGVRGTDSDGSTYEVSAKLGVVLASGGFSGNTDLVIECDDTWGFA